MLLITDSKPIKPNCIRQSAQVLKSGSLSKTWALKLLIQFS
ncbi:hypothetical protein PSPO_b0698 [Pseudoalteromonas spongiae UST010723-006]|nr:hypothetical protein PSPO_b0698 [Pseudoalteromonas spongiae UST010723-006]